MKKLTIGNNENRKFLAIIPTLILSPIIYVELMIIWVFSISFYPTNDFDENEWKVNVEERYKLSEDLIESKMLIGKTRDEVFQILGTGLVSNSEIKITYELGFVPGLFNIDPDFLDVLFENGLVVSVVQYEG